MQSRLLTGILCSVIEKRRNSDRYQLQDRLETEKSAKIAKARKKQTGKYYCDLAHYVPIASTHVDNKPSLSRQEQESASVFLNTTYLSQVHMNPRGLLYTHESE